MKIAVIGIVAAVVALSQTQPPVQPVNAVTPAHATAPAHEYVLGPDDQLKIW
jgi:hypothetical protein